MALYREVLIAAVSTSSSGSSTAADTFSSESGVSPSARVILNATAVVTTLDVDVRSVVKGRTVIIASFTQLTAPGSQQIVIPDCPKTLDLDFTIVGGTATFTVDVVRF